MNYTSSADFEQLPLFDQNNLPIPQTPSEPVSQPEYLLIPNTLTGFHNVRTDTLQDYTGRTVHCHLGDLDELPSDRICEHCGAIMHVNSSHTMRQLWHLPHGNAISLVKFAKTQYYCPACHHSCYQPVPFQADGHRITKQLEKYIRDLLARHKYTLKDISEMTGVGKGIVKDIDKKRLQELYTEETDDGRKLMKPERQAKFLAIDEFKLHNGYIFATHIMDLETGHILWIAEGKKKQVVYDFIEHVGLDWMQGVAAVACDMNSDFQEAFQERCPHLQIVFDHFHIVKNFNEKVIAPIRIEEQKRLLAEGNKEGAAQLKKGRHILTAKRTTLKEKDKKAHESKVRHKGSGIFKLRPLRRKGGNLIRYHDIILENELLFRVDIVKDYLAEAYEQDTPESMKAVLDKAIDECRRSHNKHLLWFANLLESYMPGITGYTRYPISSGKMEGVNGRIKEIRRHGYGYPDDEYFFLKLIDASRHGRIPYSKSRKLDY